MPKLTKTSLQRSQSVTAKLTAEEDILLKRAAEREDLTPSAYARKVLLSSLRSTAMERLLLAKVCKLESMTQAFFRGLFVQLNQQEAFDAEAFNTALAKADSAQYRKADELLALYSSLSLEKNEQNGAENHA